MGNPRSLTCTPFGSPSRWPPSSPQERRTAPRPSWRTPLPHSLSLSLSRSRRSRRAKFSLLFRVRFPVFWISNLKRSNMHPELRQLLYGWHRSAAAGGHGVREGEGGEGGLWIVEVGRSRGEDPVVPGRRDPARRERGEDGNDAEEGGPHGLGGEPGGEATELGARGRLARREGPRRGRPDPRQGQGGERRNVGRDGYPDERHAQGPASGESRLLSFRFVSFRFR